MSELRNLKSRIEELESDLRDRDEEVKLLKDQQQSQSDNSFTNGGSGEDGDSVKVSVTRHCHKMLFLYQVFIFAIADLANGE